MTSGCFQALLQQFFTHLRTQHEVSHHTISAYRDTFGLLLCFMVDHCATSIDQISWEAFSPDTILAFLQYLENKRLNSTRTRNARLAAIRVFVRFVLGNASPDFVGDAQPILAIPCKRSVRPVLGFLNLDEVESLLAGIDVSTRSCPETKNLIIIASSASVFADAQHLALDSECTDFLPKPLMEGELFEILEDI